MRVSVIVPAHNAAHRLPVLLDALARQTAAANAFEVIVIDDASTDDTAATVRSSHVARLVRCDIRSGPYVARNLGIRAARGAVLAFTDSDCVPASDWIERGTDAVDRLGSEMVAGQVAVSLGDSPSTPALLDFARFLDQERCVREHRFGATANLWLHADLFARVGLFNDRLTQGGDTEFGQRAVAAGANLAYAPDVVVAHASRGRAGQLIRKAARLGFGAAQHRRYAQGPLRMRPRLFTHPRAWLPSRRVYGLDRLLRHGYEPTRQEILSMQIGQYLWVSLPKVAGNLVGTAAVSIKTRHHFRSP